MTVSCGMSLAIRMRLVVLIRVARFGRIGSPRNRVCPWISPGERTVPSGSSSDKVIRLGVSTELGSYRSLRFQQPIQSHPLLRSINSEMLGSLNRPHRRSDVFRDRETSLRLSSLLAYLLRISRFRLMIL